MIETFYVRHWSVYNKCMLSQKRLETAETGLSGQKSTSLCRTASTNCEQVAKLVRRLQTCHDPQLMTSSKDSMADVSAFKTDEMF